MPAYYYDRNIGLKAAMSFKEDDFNYYVFPAFDLVHLPFDLRPMLYKINSRFLLVQGRQDLASEANIIESNQLIKASQLKFGERCGHLPGKKNQHKPGDCIRIFGTE